MTMLAKCSAFAFGALLYFAEESLLGYLAATTVPRAYFAFFGPHKVVALTLEEAVLVALPAFLVAVASGLAATRVIRGPSVRVAGWALVGLICAWSVMGVRQLIDTQSTLPADGPSLATLVWLFLVPPIWGVLTSVSVPLGVLVSGLIARWSEPPFQRAESPPLN